MDERLYRVTFHVAAPTVSGVAEYEVYASDRERAVAVAKRRAARDHIPTYTARAVVEPLDER